MFKFLQKAKDEVSAVATITAPVPEILTLPEVVERYVSTNEDAIDDDFIEVDDKITKNQKFIKFLKDEEYEAYDNEKTIYSDKRRSIEKENEKLQLQKIEIIQQLKANKAGYRKIDLSFLSMKRPTKDKRLRFHPVFSAHKYNGDGFVACSINIDSYDIEMNNGNFVPSLAVMKHLFKVFIRDLDLDTFHVGPTRLRYQEHNDSRDSTRIHTYFKGLIPTTTKEKIKKAKEIFSDKNHGIFLIKECPKWDETEITIDPLIIGVIGDQTYLIDHFNCTALEDYVKTEFTE